MDIIQLAEISLEGSASILLIVIAVKILRAKLDIKSSCLGSALQLDRNAKYGPYSQIRKYLGLYFAVFTVKSQNARPQFRIWAPPNSHFPTLRI